MTTLLISPSKFLLPHSPKPPKLKPPKTVDVGLTGEVDAEPEDDGTTFNITTVNRASSSPKTSLKDLLSPYFVRELNGEGIEVWVVRQDFKHRRSGLAAR
jgi:hypothetical protein